MWSSMSANWAPNWRAGDKTPEARRRRSGDRGRSRRRADREFPLSAAAVGRTGRRGVSADGKRRGGGSLPSRGPGLDASPTRLAAKPPSPRPRGLSCAPPVPTPQAATSGASTPTVAPVTAAAASHTMRRASARARCRRSGVSDRSPGDVCSGRACSQPWEGRARAAARSSRMLRRPRWKGSRPCAPMPHARATPHSQTSSGCG